MRDCSAIAWSSWADILPTLHRRYPTVAANVLAYLQAPHASRPRPNEILTALEAARSDLQVPAATVPSWQELLDGARPPQPPRGPADDFEADPGEWRHGWQYYTTSALHSLSQADLLQAAPPADAARYRSCKGRNNSRWLTAIPTSEALTLSNPIHQCLLRWRLGLPILPEADSCEEANAKHPWMP